VKPRAEALMARSEWRLHRVAQDKSRTVDVRSSILKLDLSDSEGQVEALVEVSLKNEAMARPWKSL